MVEFTDPITDTKYNPVGDPAGTVLQSVYIVLGLTMTLLLLGIAQAGVLPRVQSLIGNLLGIETGGGEISVEY